MAYSRCLIMKNKPRIRFKGFTEDWEQRKLSELTTMNARIGWQNLRTSEFLDSGDYLLITGTDFDNGRIKYSTCHYVEKKRFDQDTKIQLSTGSILITKDGTLGKVALVEELPKPATLNAGVFNVRVKEDTLLSYKYLYHYLKAPFLMKYVTANATGGTIKHLNQSILVDFPIPIAEKHEQDKIAKLLDSLELIITLHQRKLEKLKLAKKALLQKLFPKNGSQFPEIRFKGFTDAWEQRKVNDIFKITRGQVLATSLTTPKKTSQNIYPVYSSQTKNNGLMGYYSEYLFENAITWTTDGANAGTVNFRPGRFYSTNVNGVLINENGYACYAVSEIINKVAYKYVSKVGNPKLMNNVMAEIDIMFTENIDELGRISKLIEAYNKLITLHQGKLDKLQDVKKGLLQKMFV